MFVGKKKFICKFGTRNHRFQFDAGSLKDQSRNIQLEKMSVEDTLCRLQVHKSLDEAQIQKLNSELEQVYYCLDNIGKIGVKINSVWWNRLGKKTPTFQENEMNLSKRWQL